MFKKSILDQVRIAAPCSSDWDRMAGNDKVRFCRECNLNVYNLSGMSRREAEELVQRKEGRLCVRFYHRMDGKVLTENCPVGLRALKRRVGRLATAVTGAALGFLSGIGAYWGIHFVTPDEQLTPLSRSKTLVMGSGNDSLPILKLTGEMPVSPPVLGEIQLPTPCNQSEDETKQSPTIVRKSEGVLRSRALTRVTPEYPPLAKSAHVTGDVVMELTISEEGNVINARCMSGHPLFQQAALKAARQWKFEPTMTNNIPVKIVGPLTFRFTL